MNLIRNAIVYKAGLPSADALSKHLADLPFRPVGDSFVSSDGFIPNSTTAELVTPIEGGLAFTYRRDEKILPKAAVRSAIAAVVEAAEQDIDHPMEAEELAKLEERVRDDLISKALHGTTVVTCFYHYQSRTLVVPTTNKKLAGYVVGALVQACGAVETSTIHVSDVKGGLTSRLDRYFNCSDEDAFDGFKLGDSAVMTGKAGKVSFDLDNLYTASRSVSEALAAGLMAERLELVREQVVFRLTHNFHLRCIQFLGELTEDELEAQDDWDAAFRWRNEAAVQLLQVVDVVEQLCTLFGYQEKPANTLGGEEVPQGT